MSDLDERSWLVGIIEGEGCFDYRDTPRFNIGMIDKDVMERVARLLGTEVHEYKNTQKAHYKNVFRISTSGKEALALMIGIREHMSKRRQEQIDSVLAKITSPLLIRRYFAAVQDIQD